VNAGSSTDPSETAGTDEQQHYAGGVELAVLLCWRCDSDRIAPFASSAILG